MRESFISAFTPSQTDPDDLEEIFVQRHALLQDAVERIEDSSISGNTYHLLFVGPRGSGKTHFVTLLVHRLGLMPSIEERLQIAWLNEDETSTTVPDFLIKIYTALAKRYPEEYPMAELEPVYDYEGDLQQFLSDLIIQKLNGRTPVLILENLDKLMESLGDLGQRQLRAFFQEQALFSIVATAQAMIPALSDRKKTFYGFFQTEFMKPLSLEEAKEVLVKIATLKKQEDVVRFLISEKGYAKVRALHHLSGGNHRIFIVLSQFITRSNLDDLITPFKKMMDELTPYYQERVRALSPLQRKIIEFLCKCEETMAVKTIASRLFSSNQTIAKQLNELRAIGYVRSFRRGRESYYEVSEPLMRVATEVKENQFSKPLKLLVDFIRVWYESEELIAKRDSYGKSAVGKSYLQEACRLNEKEGNLRTQVLVKGLLEKVSAQKLALTDDKLEQYEGVLRESSEEYLSKLDQSEDLVAELDERERVDIEEIDHDLIITRLTQIIEKTGITGEQKAECLVNRSFVYSQLGEVEKELSDYTAVIELKDAPVDGVANALYNRGVTYFQKGEIEKALSDYTAVIELNNAPLELVAQALLNRGLTYSQKGEAEKEFTDYNTLIELKGARVDLVALALSNKGVCYSRSSEYELAESHFQHSIEAFRSNNFLPKLGLCVLRAREGRWGDSLKYLESYLTCLKNETDREVDLDEWLQVFYEAGLPLQKSQEIAQRVVALSMGGSEAQTFSQQLANSLVRSLSSVASGLLDITLLGRWQAVWLGATEGGDDFLIPMRLFNVGVEYLQSDPRDAKILITLKSEERVFLEQIVGVKSEDY